ncbi:MAG TPA: carbohydrate ABC transporter permease [Clostridiales bacterium]|nr:carbohydrate ABC transporter permease [Clostridiales bacterium]
MTERLSAKTRNRLATVRKYSGKTLGNIIVYTLLIEFSFVFLYPLVYMLMNSFKYDYEIVDATKQWIITKINFNNYTAAWRGLDYLHSLKNTLIVVLGSTLGHILSCSMAGYGFARFKFKGRNIMFMIAMLSLLIPAPLLLMPLYIQFAKMGMHGTFLPIILPAFFGFGLKGGLYIFLFRQFFKSLPVSYEEAAKIEGCSMVRIYARIMMPIARTTILVVFILSCVWHWNDYFEPNTYLEGDTLMLAQKIPAVASAHPTITSAFGARINMVALACCTLVILPLIIIYFIFQKQFMQGVEFTGLAN